MRRTHSNKLLEVPMDNPVKPLCQECHEPFIPKRRWQKFCSRECKAEYWQKFRRKVAEEICRQRLGGEQCQKK